MTQGRGLIRPRYAYEHDYKIANNGYVGTSPNYSWDSNLPGAYKDTRALDTGGNIDFTVGSMFTWLLDGSKTYHIITQTTAGSTRTSGNARLTAEVLTNDNPAGNFGVGCVFEFDARVSTVPLTKSPIDPWCIGLTQVRPVSPVSYISVSPFSISASGTCRRWTLGRGFVNC